MATEMAIRREATWVQMRGDSMSPTIKLREWVEIDPDITHFTGPGIYLTAWKNFKPSRIYPRQVPQLRRLDYIDGELHSISDSPHYPPFRVDADDLLIGGKMTQEA